jgi:hypothetical protein
MAGDPALGRKGLRMTHIAPCTRCPLRAGCGHRDELRKRVRGLGARSVRFNCDILRTEVRQGRRIVIRHPVLEYDDRYHDERFAVVWIEVNATISSARPDSSFSAVIDRGLIEEAMGGDPSEWPEGVTVEQVNDRRFRKTQSHIRIIRFLDEPDRKLCAGGNLLLPEGGCDRSSNGGECWCVENRRVMADLDIPESERPF